MPNPSLNTSSYFLLYKKEAILPTKIYFPTIELSEESQGNPCLLV